MAQLTLYLDEETAKRTRRAAKRSGKSLSAWARERLLAAANEGEEWPEGYFAAFGSIDDATFGELKSAKHEDDVEREEL